MIGLLTLIVCFLLFVFSCINKKNKLISPISLFYLLWTFILLLSNLNLYNMIKPSDKAYLLLLLMLVMFYFGYLFSKVKFKANNEKNNYNYTIKYNIVYIILILIITIYFFDFITILKFYNSGTPMWQIRNWLLQPFGSNNPILSGRSFFEEAFRTIIISPLEFLIVPIAAYSLFNDTKRNNKTLLTLFSVIYLLISSLAKGGGRLLFIYFIGCYILSFYLYLKKRNFEIHKKIKYKRLIVLGGILAVLIMVIYTNVRTGSGNVFKQIYTYFAMPPTLLSIWLSMTSNAQHTYGLLSFFGIHSYFFRFLQTVGLGSLVPSIYNLSYSYICNAEKFIYIGSGVSNAFVTPVYYFYLDGGWIFTALFSFIFGFIVSKKYKSILNNINFKNFIIYVLIIYGIFLSFMRIMTCIPAYIIAFIAVNFIFRKEEKSNDN